ncbi:hypothetical protein UFOVP99_11 [uncultured Caudovirales phage]|uniref:Uncharacterized protein n=1 Tax=uncultured Caudovirales phage TaxID=2100421 RepID=A0A6J5L3H3_9CAUD|nr:hypothetical protein UFOVP99_11 [uncultured Caudovirales phage]
MTRQLLTSAGVAAKLGHSVAWFYRQRLALEGRGFPRPVDGCGNRWDQVAIDRWLDQQAGAGQRGQTPEDLLIARAAAMGGAHAAG